MLADQLHPDRDIVTAIPPLTTNAATAALVYEGDALPVHSKHTLFVAEGNVLKQFHLRRHESSYRAGSQRDVAIVQPGASISNLQTGPDGVIWMLVHNQAGGRLMRLAAGTTEEVTPTPLRLLPSTNLVELLAHANSWQRERAAAIVAARNDLPNSRGLHPGPRLHQLAFEHPDYLVRSEALWSLRRMRLMEEYHLEQSYLDTNEWVRATAARLVGERRLPTGMAFTVLEKLAQQKTNPVVRSAVAVAARQFASGSLLLETAPPIPVREVFAGGLLSTLWFNSDHADDPIIFWQFWNAISPITSFDPAHPLSFFRSEQTDAPHRLMRFVIRNILRQAALASDRSKLHDAFVALAAWHPKNSGAMKAALLGVLDATAEKTLQLTPAEQEVIQRWLPVQEYGVGELAAQILAQPTIRVGICSQKP